MIEDPDALMRRLRLGREEYVQRLLTMLIVDGPYPRWNTESGLSTEGVEFLRRLEAMSFGGAEPWTNPSFIDELDLPRRHVDEKGSAPDWALRDARRLWMIELKTERGSHRPAQLPAYFDLGRHHHPTHQIDLTYLTGALEKPAPAIPEGSRYAHLIWADVLPLVRGLWHGTQPAVVEQLENVLGALDQKWTAWRDTTLAQPEPSVIDPVELALQLARLTADDHQQRALEYTAGSLEELQEIRLLVSRALRESDDEPLRHVAPWLWNVASTDGKPMADAGRDVGYELRLSWGRKPV